MTTTAAAGPEATPGRFRDRPAYRWLLAVGAVVLVAGFVLGWVWRTVLAGGGLTLFFDFDVYLGGGQAAWHRLPLYDLRFDAGPYPDLMPFTYPPFAALVFGPLAALGSAAAAAAWAVANVAGVGLVVWWSLGLLGLADRRRRAGLTVAATVGVHLLDPVVWNLSQGQINVLLMVLVLADFRPGGSTRWRGVGVGLAAGIKLTPLVFVLYLAATGQPRAALRAGLVFLATVGVGFAVLPSAATRYWFDGIFLDTARVLVTPLSVNHSLPGLLSRFAGSMTPPWWALAVGVVVGVAGLAVAVLAHRRGQVLLGVVLVALTSVLVSPVSWSHHAVWFVPALVWLACARWRTAGVLPPVFLVVLAGWLTVPTYWLAQRFVAGDLPYQYTATGNLLATLGGTLGPVLAVLASLPWWFSRLAPPAGSATS